MSTRDRERYLADHDAIEAPARRKVAPGKVSLSMQIPSARVLPGPRASSGPPIQRRNAVDLRSRDWQEDSASVAAVQARLCEVTSLTEADYEPGEMNDATRAAITEFQSSHASDIEQVRADSARMESQSGPDATGAVESGSFEANDATHQALANAWPRTMFGSVINTPEQGYQFIRALVRSRGLPFDASQVNIIGIRGYQGGAAHANEGAGRRNNRYNDTMFILAKGETDQHMTREFRGTCDPGGRSDSAIAERAERSAAAAARRRGTPLTEAQQTQAGRAAIATSHRRGGVDPNTEAMAANQQLPYVFNNVASNKFDRPLLGPRPAGPDGEARVHDPNREREVEAAGGIRYSDDRNREPAGQLPEEGRYNRQRTIQNTDDSHPQTARDHGIAIHSGGGDDTVFADSTGCQVVHGDWYGSFIDTLRRALHVHARRARGEDPTIPPDAESLGPDGDRGTVMYSLLDGAEIQAALAAPAETAAPESPAFLDFRPGPAVQPLGDVRAGERDVQAVAHSGVRGSGQSMPHLDRINSAFGQYQLTGVHAHIGGRAARASEAIGAEAYATGNDIAFRKSPDLFTAAHEAAHVVQQRAGVSLSTGVGREGDAYERQADAVAERVVAGQSAVPVLSGNGGGAGSGARSNSVQRRPSEGLAPAARPNLDQHLYAGLPTHGAAPIQMRRDRATDRDEGRQAPPSQAGSFGQPYESTIEAMEAEAYLWATLIPSSAAMFGTEVADLWRRFLSREPGDSLTPVVFSEAAGSAVAFTFKHCSEIQYEQDVLLDTIVGSLGNLPSLPANQWHTEPLSTFVATPHALDTNFGNPYNTPGHIAGGISGSDAGPDTRSVTGSVRFFRRTDEAGVTTELIIEPRLEFQVADAIDFIPGGAGTGMEQMLTVPLSRLEATGWAYDVPFQVAFTGPVARRTVTAAGLGGQFATDPEDAQRQERQRTPAAPREDERSRSRWGEHDPADLREGVNPDDSRRRDL